MRLVSLQHVLLAGMPKKHKLTGDFSPEYTVIGISSQARGYKLAMQVNEKLGLHLRRVEDFPKQGTEGRNYALYEDQAKDSRRLYYLLSNRHPEGLLATALKGIDAFIVIFECLSKMEISELLLLLRKGQGIQAAYEIKVETVKDFDLMLEDLEVHLMNRPPLSAD